MSKSNVNGPEGRETIEDPVTELLRVGAQQLIQRAVEAELAELLSQHGGRRMRQETPGWYATVICRNANCRRDWVR